MRSPEPSAFKFKRAGPIDVTKARSKHCPDHCPQFCGPCPFKRRLRVQCPDRRRRVVEGTDSTPTFSARCHPVLHWGQVDPLSEAASRRRELHTCHRELLSSRTDSFAEHLAHSSSHGLLPATWRSATTTASSPTKPCDIQFLCAPT